MTRFARWLLRRIGAVPGVEVHVLTVHTRSDDIVSVHLSKESADSALIEFVKDNASSAWWPAQLQEALADNDQDGIIAAYFEDNHKESYTLTTARLYG